MDTGSGEKPGGSRPLESLAITRRDFVGNTLIGSGVALLAAGAPLAAMGAATGAGNDFRLGRTMPSPLNGLDQSWTGYGGVGDYATANGNTHAVVNAAHTLLNGDFRERVAELGLLPAAAEPPRPPKARPWHGLSAAERRVQARAMAVYAAMIDEVDVHSGRLLDYLASTGELDDTLVIFLSDNGPEGHDLDETWPADVFPEIRKVIDERHDFSVENMGRPGSYTLYGAGWARAGAPGLRLYKGFPSEGGTRVAAFMHFPAGIRGGRIVSEPVSVEDLAPTILDYAGVPRHRGSYRGRAVYPMGGLSLAPMLSGAPWTPGTRGVELFGKYALRDGDWKLLVMPPPYASGRAELYNIAEDPGESRNLAAEHPQKLSAMLANWRRYQTENGVILPDWVSGY